MCKPVFEMPAVLALVFLANLLAEVTLAADSCYSCMTCTAGTEAVFTAALGLVGTTNSINDYAEAPTFPTAQTNCPLDGEGVQKATMTIAGTNCLSGYWVYKDTDGAIVQSCTAAIPVEELFKAADGETTTAETLKPEMAKLTADGLKDDLTLLTTAEDKKGTASIAAMFTICSEDDCNTPKENEFQGSSLDAGAYDADKLANKKALATEICAKLVADTKGTMGHLCHIDSAGEKAAAASSSRRARREVANDKLVLVIAVGPGTELTAANIATAYAAALTAVKTTNSGDADKKAILDALPSTATFAVVDASGASSNKGSGSGSFSTPLFFSNLLLVLCFSFRAFL